MDIDFRFAFYHQKIAYAIQEFHKANTFLHGLDFIPSAEILITEQQELCCSTQDVTQDVTVSSCFKLIFFKNKKVLLKLETEYCFRSAAAAEIASILGSIQLLVSFVSNFDGN